MAILSLPQELRDDIYKYLLRSDYVEIPSSNGNPPTYRFYTEILRVNRRVYKEARQFLYTKNTFIIISYHWKNSRMDLQRLGIPIITEKHTSEFKEHVLQIHMIWPKGLTPCHCHSECTEDALGTYLVIANDLPLFCRLFRVINFRIMGDVVIIKSARGEKPIRWQGGEETIQSITNIEFRSTSYRSPSIDEQKRLLLPWRDVCGIAHKVLIWGEVNTSLAEEVATNMAPKLVWSYAIGWNLLSLMRSWKDDADSALRAGNLLLALCRYRFIVDTIKANIIPATITSKHPSRDWANGLSFLRYDSQTTCVQICVKLGHYHGAHHHAHDLLRISDFKLLYYPEERIAKARHWSAIVIAELVSQSFAFQLLRRVKTKLPADPGILHDLAISRRHVDMMMPGDEVISPAGLLLGQRRISAAAPLTFTRSSLTNVPIVPINTPWSGTCPEGLEGWRDTRHELSEEDVATLGL